MIATLRKCSLWTAMVGFGFFVAGEYEAAFIVRLVTEGLRLPYFIQERVTDQIALGVFVSVGCVFGLVRMALQA